MEDFSVIKAVASLVPILHKLNGEKVIKTKDKYPCLKTRKRNVANWWNGLDKWGKIDVGSAALHYHKMTPNYRWKCLENDKFEDLSKGQQKIVKFVFSKRNTNWYMFDIGGMFKL